MTATAPNTASEAPPMAHTPDLRTGPPEEATAAAEPAAAGTRSRRWAVLGDSPLLTLVVAGAAAVPTVLGTVAVAVLLFAFNSMSDRLDRLEDTVAAGFAAQDAKLEAKFAELDKKIDEVDLRLTAKIDEVDLRLTAKIDELDLRLTAQIAEVDRRLTAQIDEVDRRLTAQIAEVDRKLTALVASLNMADEVDAALEGRLLDLDSESVAGGPDGEPG